MMLLFQAALLLLAVAVESSAACDMFSLGDCSAKCGEGFASGPLKCSENGTEFVCGTINVTCNSAPCDGGPGPWSECSVSCGGGTKNRTVGNDTQTLPCNTQSCNIAECPNSAADIVFVIDSSNSITDFGFEAAKQIVSDAVSGLPTAVRVSLITFSTKADVVFALTESPSSTAILAPRFTGGTGILTYALLAAAPALSSSKAAVSKILVFISDGEQMVLEACANDIAKTMRDGGVIMLSVVIGSAAPSALYPVTSPEFNEHQFLSTDVYAARKISAAIVGTLANCTASNDDEAELDDTDLLKGGPMMFAGVSDSTCGPWSDWSDCSESCGVSGMHEKVMKCVDESGEMIRKFKFERCMIVCPEPEPETVCLLADWLMGRVWIPHPGNCHLYFVCELVYRSKFRMHGVDCGELYWNQDTLLCEEDLPNPNVVDCDDVVNVEQYPPILGSCSDPSLLLQFDFESGFVDKCQGVSLIPVLGTVTLTQEGPNTVACFDGNSFMQIPFLQSWFAGKQVTEFSVAVWYKRCSDDTRLEQGLIHNGGCAAVNTGFQVTTGYGGVFAGITTADPFPPGLKQLFAVTAPGADWKDKAGWQQAVMVFDAENVKLYLQGYERERAPSESFMLNGDSPAFLGKLCDGKFFCGCIDNVRIWSRALTPTEVLYLQTS